MNTRTPAGVASTRRGVADHEGVDMSKTSCSIASCGSPTLARGWCVKHYKRWRTHGDATHCPPPRYQRSPRVGTCSEVDCGEPVRTRGWCRIHYDRWRRTGDPSVRLKTWNRASDVIESGVKYCPKCEQTLPLDAFGLSRGRGVERQRYCRTCRRDYARERYQAKPAVRKQRAEYFKRFRESDPEQEKRRQRAAKLMMNYGLTIEEFEARVAAQGGVCAICAGGPNDRHGTDRKKALAVDHCHATGSVRGLLCDNCNMGIGMFRDDPSLLLAAIEYLARTAAAA